MKIRNNIYAPAKDKTQPLIYSTDYSTSPYFNFFTQNMLVMLIFWVPRSVPMSTILKMMLVNVLLTMLNRSFLSHPPSCPSGFST